MWFKLHHTSRGTCVGGATPWLSILVWRLQLISLNACLPLCLFGYSKSSSCVVYPPLQSVFNQGYFLVLHILSRFPSDFMVNTLFLVLSLGHDDCVEERVTSVSLSLERTTHLSSPLHEPAWIHSEKSKVKLWKFPSPLTCYKHLWNQSPTLCLWDFLLEVLSVRRSIQHSHCLFIPCCLL